MMMMTVVGRPCGRPGTRVSDRDVADESVVLGIALAPERFKGMASRWAAHAPLAR